MRIVLVALVIFLSGCSGLFFYPETQKFREPSLFGLRFSERVLQDEMGPNLVFWDLPSVGSYKGTILFLHGNAGNISTHLPSVVWLPERGYRVIIFDYRGYGGSEGVADIVGMHNDAARMMRYTAQQEPNPNRRILFGQSLGASITLYTANDYTKEIPFKVIIADSPFSSYRAIAREKMSEFWLLYPLQMPLGWMFSDEYAPINHVGDIKVPVLLLHGDKDEIVPPHHSADLCVALGGHCALWVVPEATHIAALARRDVRNRLVEWIESVPSL